MLHAATSVILIAGLCLFFFCVVLSLDGNTHHHADVFVVRSAESAPEVSGKLKHLAKFDFFYHSSTCHCDRTFGHSE